MVVLVVVVGRAGWFMAAAATVVPAGWVRLVVVLVVGRVGRGCGVRAGLVVLVGRAWV
ncbi:hypothetical protein MULP_01989 [Mycobacterium liflandii 128FXT]|uniref:Uncharacterized protein n=1 Tax=Mycobacterium liflandii (strain 128FXT) TaxID=459424 RepID=L7V625_MYCL1|nr:hypothetical protein MULP_01989 [Mycobacterium liflandii 128FXT]